MECALDIGNHLIADQGLPTPKVYKDIFAILADAKVIPAALAASLQKWAGFRDILVHNYLEIDHGIAYDALSLDFQALEDFAARAASFL